MLTTSYITVMLVCGGQMTFQSSTAKADIERAYHHYCQDTWEALSNMYEEINGDFPDPNFDLLRWFLLNYDLVGDKWIYIKRHLN